MGGRVRPRAAEAAGWAVHAEAVHAEAVHAEAVHAEAVHAEAVHAEAAHAEAVHAEAVHTGGARPAVPFLNTGGVGAQPRVGAMAALAHAPACLPPPRATYQPNQT